MSEGVAASRYTFGVTPLQQYLIEFPDGRLQALSIAWDTRPQEVGGQRWFHLYPGETLRPPGRCTGQGGSRPGATSVPSATRPTCASTTTPDRIATPPCGPRSWCRARPATTSVALLRHADRPFGRVTDLDLHISPSRIESNLQPLTAISGNGRFPHRLKSSGSRGGNTVTHSSCVTLSTRTAI